MATLFASDLHLAASRPEICEQFETFLAGPVRQAERVYLLGDLFEYWAGDDDLADPFNARVIAALAADRGRVPIYLMHGNRDFLAGAAFAKAARVMLLEDPFLVELYERKTLITHGDSLCTDDTAYQRFRAESRTPEWRAAMLGTPLAERKRRIEALRQQSEMEKRGKAAGIMDVNTDALAASFRFADCDRMIHGHTHRPGKYELMVDGVPRERWVLDAWYEQGSYLAVDHDGCRMMRLV
jgi:UDP-2,3-diacylglucosamine hydrolase